ncbi:hypothetical protein [Nostoc sp. CCY 9925]|uniref:hypothetical protein n=1 Tax=Nostoc sp. CCY 9925 TaxID=3103865 RepID=UPI0039C61FC4
MTDASQSSNQARYDNQVEQTAVKDIQAENITVGDITQTVNQFFQQRNDFFKRENLDEYDSIYFTSPIKIQEIIKTLYEQRLLVLGGIHPDKKELCWHLAAKLRKQINNSIPIWEWNGNSNPQSLVAAIRGEGDEELKNYKHATQIFVLTELKPQYNLSQIQQAVRKSKNYVIATTNVPINQWTTITEREKRLFWWEPSKEYPLYNPEDLGKALIQKLENKKSLNNEIKLYLQKTVAEKLNTVASVENCIQLLLAEKEISQEIVRKTVDIAKQDREISLKIWFRSLQIREQLLALSLSLFDGLFDDQFFAALEKVVKNVWQQRDSTLRALDYCDLENLGNYFKFSKITVYVNNSKGFKFVNTTDYPREIEISLIEIDRTEDRPLLFKVAWETHRRQIFTALSEIVEMVKESVEKPPYNWELYGNSIRSERLRNTISQTLSDIGLVSTSATNEVQQLLLRLASEPSFEVQDVAARAIARWYLDGREKEVFITLQNFWSIAIEKENNTQKTADWQNYIAATVALSVSYAAANVSSQEFSEKFLNWLKELSNNPSFIVRAYFGYHTLYYLVSLHLDQLQQMLKEWTQKYQELNQPIAVALARAYEARPNEVQKLLNSWYREASDKLSMSKKVAEISQYEHLLATVALTYGEIEFHGQGN